MLLEFKFSNFLSFRNETVFSLAAKPNERNAVVVDEGKTSAFVGAAVFGANGSGKSNLFKSLSFAAEFVKNGRGTNDPIKRDHFALDTESQGKPSTFEFAFVAGGKKYRYSFSVNDTTVLEEKLLAFNSQRPTTMFYRGAGAIDANRNDVHGAENKVRPNELAITKFAAENVGFAKEVHSFFGNFYVVPGALPGDSLRWLSDMGTQAEFIGFVSDMFKRANVDSAGFGRHERPATDLELNEMIATVPQAARTPFLNSSSVKIATVVNFHNVRSASGAITGNIPFDFYKNESDGTKRLFNLCGPLFGALKEEKVVFIDEFDASMHSSLALSVTKVLLEKLKDSKVRSQIVISTHNPSLMDVNDLFSKGQIWLVEKDNYESSSVTQLSAFRSINSRLSTTALIKRYLAGAFGGIPSLREYISPNNPK